MEGIWLLGGYQSDFARNLSRESMAVDALRQVTGTAGATQVDGARRVGTLNIGGSTATTCSLVIERIDP